jgi:hypothetical protein
MKPAAGAEERLGLASAHALTWCGELLLARKPVCSQVVALWPHLSGALVSSMSAIRFSRARAMSTNGATGRSDTGRADRAVAARLARLVRSQ